MLAKLTKQCGRRAGRRLTIASRPQTDPVDIPFYVSDNSAVTAATGWRPEVSLDEMLDDIFEWLCDHRGEVEAILR